MKFTVFNGSPAADQSRTQVIADAFLSGAQRAGAETETIYLIEKDIRYCRGCFACWFKNPGRCIIDDDAAGLLQKYLTSDVVVWATPVYTWDMTACLKNFIDRLMPLKGPSMIKKNGHSELLDVKVKNQRFAVISNCGFPGDNNFDVMRAVFRSFHPFLEIYRNCGILLKSEDFDVKRKIDAYLEAVEQAGYESVSGKVSEKVRQALDMPLMSDAEYIKYIGMHSYVEKETESPRKAKILPVEENRILDKRKSLTYVAGIKALDVELTLRSDFGNFIYLHGSYFDGKTTWQIAAESITDAISFREEGKNKEEEIAIYQKAVADSASKTFHTTAELSDSPYRDYFRILINMIEDYQRLGY